MEEIRGLLVSASDTLIEVQMQCAIASPTAMLVDAHEQLKAWFAVQHVKDASL